MNKEELIKICTKIRSTLELAAKQNINRDEMFYDSKKIRDTLSINQVQFML